MQCYRRDWLYDIVLEIGGIRKYLVVRVNVNDLYLCHQNVPKTTMALVIIIDSNATMFGVCSIGVDNNIIHASEKVTHYLFV